VSLTIVVTVGNSSLNWHNVIKIAEKIEDASVFGIFVFDDPNVDTSEKLSKIISSKTNCRTLFSSSRNPGGSRNIGLDAAESKWIQFCDSDDMVSLHPSLLNALDSKYSAYDALVCSYSTEDTLTGVRSGKHPTSLIDATWNPGIWRWLFKRESIKSLRFYESRIGEDQFFLCNFLALNPKLHYLKDMVYTYRVNSSASLTSNFSNIELKHTINAITQTSYHAVRLKFALSICLVVIRLNFTYVSRLHSGMRFQIMQEIFHSFGSVIHFCLKMIGLGLRKL
jgi:glycosyltransferase involved in cell wall biosynthesis